MLEMEVTGVVLDPTTSVPIIILRSKKGREVLPIWVGIFEALAISRGLEGVKTPRPLTHDLIQSIIEKLKIKVTEVRIVDLQDNTFFAQIVLRTRAKTITVDARPSDAIAVALRTKVPIYVEDKVLKGARSIDQAKELGKEYKNFLEDLKEEDFGKYKM